MSSAVRHELTQTKEFIVLITPFTAKINKYRSEFLAASVERNNLDSAVFTFKILSLLIRKAILYILGKSPINITRYAEKPLKIFGEDPESPTGTVKSLRFAFEASFRQIRRN